MSETRIRRDNLRDSDAVARLYAEEDSDRGFLARQLLRVVAESEERECICGEINARHCPVHSDPSQIEELEGR